MKTLVNIDQYPLHKPHTPAWNSLVETCNNQLEKDGLFNLPGFLNEEAVSMAVAELKPPLTTEAFTHARKHNIYFKKHIEGLEPTHPALTEFETSNRTICADQMGEAMIIRLYEWEPFEIFLAEVMGKSKLFTMDDPLARVNVMGYAHGQALNWHFDRSEFTTTLLLQAPSAGGDFEYDKDLRSETDPNYAGVAALLRGQRQPVRMALEPGTLNVFKGKNTAHRVTPVEGDEDRIIAVFSYYEQPGVMFSPEERLGFYGRAS
ncbi:MAG: 2OG-Fe(II) oxygenase [Rhizobiaceae bacterium]